MHPSKQVQKLTNMHFPILRAHTAVAQRHAHASRLPPRTKIHVSHSIPPEMRPTPEPAMASCETQRHTTGPHCPRFSVRTDCRTHDNDHVFAHLRVTPWRHLLFAPPAIAVCLRCLSLSDSPAPQPCPNASFPNVFLFNLCLHTTALGEFRLQRDCARTYDKNQQGTKESTGLLQLQNEANERVHFATHRIPRQSGLEVVALRK